MRNRYLTILTGLLLIVGGLLLIQRMDQGDTTYADQASYERAREKGEVSEAAPVLPPCAEQIVVTQKHSAIESITFSCAERGAREAFVSEIKKGFLWNVLIFEGVRVHLTPAQQG